MEIFKVMLVLLVVVLLLVVAAHDPVIITNSAVNENHLVCEGDYTLATGDTLALIAIHCGVSTASILEDNPHIPDAHAAHPGDTIHLSGEGAFPGKAETCPKCAQAAQQPESAMVLSIDESHEYVVQQGDTLESIARKHNVSVQSIRRLNLPLATSDRVSWGQVLIIPPQ